MLLLPFLDLLLQSRTEHKGIFSSQNENNPFNNICSLFVTAVLRFPASSMLDGMASRGSSQAAITKI